MTTMLGDFHYGCHVIFTRILDTSAKNRKKKKKTILLFKAALTIVEWNCWQSKLSTISFRYHYANYHWLSIQRTRFKCGRWHHIAFKKGRSNEEIKSYTSSSTTFSTEKFPLSPQILYSLIWNVYWCRHQTFSNCRTCTWDRGPGAQHGGVVRCVRSLFCWLRPIIIS